MRGASQLREGGQVRKLPFGRKDGPSIHKSKTEKMSDVFRSRAFGNGNVVRGTLNHERWRGKRWKKVAWAINLEGEEQ